MTQSATRVNLPSPLKQTSESIELLPDGTLVAEFYDFSGNQGSDVAWGIKISKESQLQLLTLLLNEAPFKCQARRGSAQEQLFQLLPIFPQRFGSYQDFKSWVEDHKIPFTKYYEPWA